MKIWFNAHFHSMVSAHLIYKKVLTDQGKIIAFDDDIKDDDAYQKIDLKGMHVYPGFTDAHTHLMGIKLKEKYIDLNAYHHKQDILNHLKSLKSDKPLIGFGLSSEIKLTDIDLDSLNTNQIIVLRHQDYHSYTINKAAEIALEIKTDYGYITDSKALDRYWSKLDFSAYESILESGIKSYYRYGITGVHAEDLGYYNGYHETKQVYETVLKKMPFRVHMLIHQDALDAYLKDDRTKDSPINFGAVKTFMDGTISSKTAYLSIPYQDSNQNGINYYETVHQTLLKARSNHLNIAIHTIGDQALSMVIDLLRKYPPKHGYDRIIHASLVRVDDINRLKNMKVCLDVQPQFIKSDDKVIKQLIYPSILSYPLSLFLQNQILMTGGSDAPVEIHNPLLGIYEATKHQNPYRISRYEALKLYTTNPYKILENDTDGKFLIGSRADFSIFTQNILETEEKSLLSDLVYMTVIDEQIVFKKI